MSFAAIAYAALQYEDFANQYLKAFEQGTTTPLPMATDATGITTASKFQLNAQGFPVTAGSVKVIPFIDGAYDLWIIPTAAEADTNDTTNAIQIADDIIAPPVAGQGSTAIQELTTATMTANTNKSYEVGDVVQTAEFSDGDGGGGTYDAVLTSSVTPNTFDIIVGAADTSISFVLRNDGLITPQQVGAASDGTGSPSAAFERIADIATILINKGVFANVKISNKSDLKMVINGGSFISAASTNSPAFWLDTCTLNIQGNIVANGNKSNNSNSLTDSNLSAATSTLSIQDCNGNIIGNLKSVAAYHDGVSLDGGSNLTINGDIISTGAKNRLMIASGGMTALKHSGSIIISSNDNAGAHGLRVGSLVSDPDTEQNKFGDVFSQSIKGISVLMEAHAANNTVGNILNIGSGSSALKIEDNDGTIVGDIRSLSNTANETVILNSCRKVQLGDLHLISPASDGLFIDSATGIGTNAEDITVGNIWVNGAGGDGIAVRSSLASGATKNIVLGKVNVTDCTDNGLRVYDTFDGFSCSGGILLNNNTATGFFDFRVDPGITNVQWGAMVYGSGSAQVGDSGINPYKESGLNVKAFVTFTVAAGTVTVINQRGVTATPTSPGPGDIFIVWDAVIADNDPVISSSNNLQASGVRETTASGNRSRISIFDMGTATPADTASPITVSLLE